MNKPAWIEAHQRIFCWWITNSIDQCWFNEVRGNHELAPEWLEVLHANNP